MLSRFIRHMAGGEIRIDLGEIRREERRYCEGAQAFKEQAIEYDLRAALLRDLDIRVRTALLCGSCARYRDASGNVASAARQLEQLRRSALIGRTIYDA